MKWGTFYVTLILSLSMNSCEKANNTSTKTEPLEIILTSAETKVAAYGNNIAFTYLANISQQEALDNKRKNVMISPLSLNFAMAMCWNGADGQTKEQVKNTLGFVGNSDEEVNSYFKKMAETLPKTDPSVKLSIANSMWHDKNFAVLESFKNTNRKWFNASIQSLDFSNSQSVNVINDWCANNTNGMIKKILDEIDPSEVLFLINALYFKAPWKNEFKEENTAMQPFYLRGSNSLNASTMSVNTSTMSVNASTMSVNASTMSVNASTMSVNVPTMKQEITCKYSEGVNYRAATLPYGNEASNMTIILPNEGFLPEDIFATLSGIPNQNVAHSTTQAEISNTTQAETPSTSISWTNIINEKSTTKLDIYLPKFKFEYEIEFNDILIKMGITDAFSPSLANFSRISTKKDLVISKVLQKTAIEVNEKGSEAAAVTSVGIGETSVGPNKNEFRVNRPFIFVISEKYTGAILFAGKVENPTKYH